MRVFFSVLLAALAAFPGAALAQESVLVLELASSEAHRDTAALLTERLRAEIAAVQGWEVNPARLTFPAARVAHGCDEQQSDRECLPRIAQATGVGHIVFGTLREHNAVESNPFTIALQHYDVAAGRYAGSAYRSIRTDGSEAELTARLQTLLGAEDLDIRTRMPRPAAEAQQPVVHAAPDRGLYIGLGIGSFAIGAAWLVATVASAVRINDIQHDPAYATYRERVPPGTTNICTEAGEGNGWTYDEAAVRSLCDEAATLEVLQFVFLGAAAAFAGLGTAFLLLEPGTEHPAVSITPSLGPDRASLSLSGRF